MLTSSVQLVGFLLSQKLTLVQAVLSGRIPRKNGAPSAHPNLLRWSEKKEFYPIEPTKNLFCRRVCSRPQVYLAMMQTLRTGRNAPFA